MNKNVFRKLAIKKSKNKPVFSNQKSILIKKNVAKKIMKRFKCAKCTKIIIKQFQICKIIVKNVFIIYSIKCVLKSKVDFGIGTDIVLYILILFTYRIRKLYVPIRREKK